MEAAPRSKGGYEMDETSPSQPMREQKPAGLLQEATPIGLLYHYAANVGRRRDGNT